MDDKTKSQIPTQPTWRDRLAAGVLFLAYLARRAAAQPLWSAVTGLLLLIDITVIAIDKGFVRIGIALISPVVLVIAQNLRCDLVGRPATWPPWFFRINLANLAMGLVALFLPINLDDWLVIAWFLAWVALYLILIPVVLTGFSGLLARVPGIRGFARRRLTPANLYAGILLGVTGFLVYFAFVREEIWLVSFLAITGGVVAIALRRTLWEGLSGPLWARLLPHVPVGILIGALTIDFMTGLNAHAFFEILVVGITLFCVIAATLYWSLQRLRQTPVEAIQELGLDRIDSVQARAANYVDVQGLSRRLVQSIERSDGGVFGVTGVRGAGKSALTRHVLSVLEPRYFVREVTAPVRHDPNMGFFTAVCRSLVGKVLHDLGPILHGKASGAGSRVARQLRNLALVLLALGAAGSAFVHFWWVPGSAGQPTLAGLSRSPRAIVMDPLLGDVPRGETLALRAERTVVDHLLDQIEAALQRGAEGEGHASYLLVPDPHKRRFLLLRVLRGSDFKADLKAYQDSIATVFFEDDPLLPYSFFANGLSLADQGYINVRGSGESVYVISLIFSDDRLRNQSYVRSEYFYEGWQKLTDNILDHPSILPPLRHLKRELRRHLRAPDEVQQGPQAGLPTPAGAAPDAPASASPTDAAKLLSSLILESFRDADPGLAFNRAKLTEFGEAVRVYRHLLDGDVIAATPGTATKKALGMQGLLPRADWQLSYADPVTLFWGLLALILLLLLLGPAWRGLSVLARSLVNLRLLESYADAADFDEQLAYSSSQESSTGFSWRGLNIGRKRTLAARDFTLPGLTARYTQFLGKRVRPIYNGKIVVAIDELDKVHDPEEVKQLLTEIKGALSAQGTFYIISLSEDAARSFRRRLASGRDILESTFDEVIDIRQMDMHAALAMLQPLEQSGGVKERLPRKTLEVAALFGGGIPREIIRARRTLSYSMKNPAEATPAWAVRTLLGDELRQWEWHLGETNLTGEDTIRLRTLTRKAIEALNAGADDTETYNAVWDALNGCIAVIDPDGLRASVGYVAEDAVETPGTEDVRYAHIAGDLQADIRLLILTHTSERVLANEGGCESYAARILECHRALADKPALAENLLLEMRANHSAHSPMSEDDAKATGERTTGGSIVES